MLFHERPQIIEQWLSLRYLDFSTTVAPHKNNKNSAALLALLVDFVERFLPKAGYQPMQHRLKEVCFRFPS